MNFIKYSCFYLFHFFLKRGKPYENSIVSAVLMVSASLFFYFLSPLVFLRLVNLNKYVPKTIIGMTMPLLLAVALLIYILLYFNIERPNKFLDIIKRYSNENARYKSYWVVSFVIGGFIAFIMSMILLYFLT